MGTYAGAFEDGIRNGEGTMTFNDGITYTGKWDKQRPGEYPELPRITYPSSDADDTQGDSPIQEPTNRRLAEVPAAHPHAKTLFTVLLILLLFFVYLLAMWRFVAMDKAQGEPYRARKARCQ